MASLFMRAAGGASLWSARRGSSTTCELMKSSSAPGITTSFSAFVILRREQQSIQKDRSIAIASSQCCCCMHSTSTSISTSPSTSTSIATSPSTSSSIATSPSTSTSFSISPSLTFVKKGEKQSPKLLREVFAELELPAIQEMVGGVRVRQHVNPLKASLVAPLAPVKWEAVFANCTLPLMVDIGCGPGRLLMVLAKRSVGTQNFLGLDVRERLVDRAKLWTEELNLSDNVHFVTANATVAFSSLMATYPGPLAYVSILCPDPHFKRRHRKRKIVQKQLVDAILHYLEPGGKIFVQSDVKDVAVEMRAEFYDHLGSSLQLDGGDNDGLGECNSDGWNEENPLGVPSEREAHVVASGGRVYRAVYRRI